jgi:type I restriction-modification system S subunit
MAFNLRNGYDIDASFLYYYLKNYRWEGSNKAVMGITLNKATISKHKIAIPPKPTQLSIVSELDKLNELIRIKKEQLKDYDTLAQSIFYEMFGDPVVNEKGWEVKKFGDLFKLKSGDGLSSKDFNTGIYPVYGGNGISGYHNSFNMKGCYIIIGRVGVYCGNVRKVDGEFWLTDNAFRLIYKENEQNSFFILYLLNILDLHQYANAAAQPVISNLTLKSINVPLPPLSLQQSFAHKIEQIDRQKAEVQKTITDLETLLAARMQHWFD